MKTLLIDRYPGARPFADNPNDQRLFYGRDEEIDTLFHRICAARLLVFFGKSGLGKTSLLQAGVFPKLRERHLLPIPVRLNIKETPLAIIKTAAYEACRNHGIDYTPGIGETLWEFFKTSMFWQGEVLLTPVLVFDQFEEIFTLKNAGERAALTCELGDLFRGTLPQSVRQQRQSSENHSSADSPLSEQPPDVRVILSLREDFLGALQELAADIPGIFDDRVRLGSLSDEQAERAICAPAGLKQDAVPGGQFATPPFAYDGDTLAVILVFLRGKSGVIEPFQLQLVCRDIEKQVALQQAKGNPIAIITPKEMGGRKRLDALVQNFYRQTLDKLPRGDRRHAQRLCEEGLLNAEGFRLLLQENEILKSYKLSCVALDALVESRLLRKEPRLESFFYELSHDSLARPILNSRPWKLTRKQRAYGYGGVVILICLSVFGYLQVQAKREAEAAEERAVKAREAAEDVLNYLVFNLLPNKLTLLGHLDIVEEVQDQVTHYYDKVGIEGQSATVLNRRGAAYAGEGDRHFNQGELEKAQEDYQQFLYLVGKAATLEPDNADWQREVSVSFEKLGDVLNAQGKRAKAQQYYQESLAIRQKLIAMNPGNTGWQRDVSMSFVKLGDVLKAQGKQAEAQQYYKDGLGIMQKLTALEPGNTPWQLDVTVSLNKLGDVLKAQGKLTEAQQYYQEGLAIMQKLTALDPSNTAWQRAFSVSLNKLGDVLDVQGKQKEAQQYYQDGLAIMNKLTTLDPSNTGWQRVYAVSMNKLGNMLNTQGKLTEAQQYYQDGLAIMQKLTALDPSNTGWQRDVSISFEKLGDVLNAQGKPAEAQQYYQEGLAIRQKLAELDPGNTEWQRDLSIGHQNLGMVLVAQKEVSEALDEYQKSLDICERLVSRDPGNAIWQTDLAWVYGQMLPLMLELNRYTEAAEIAQRRVTNALIQSDSQVNKHDLAEAYGNLAWYELFNRKPQNAIDASEKGLKIDVDELTRTVLNAHLAHAYLFSGQYQKAKELYLNNKDKKLLDGRSFKQGLMNDFKEFRKHGINRADMKKIEALMH